MPSWLYSGKALSAKGTHHLQFYDGNKSPSQKKVSLGTKRKRVAQKLKRKYEDAYALGEYDPGTVNCRGAYRTSTVLADSPQAELRELRPPSPLRSRVGLKNGFQLFEWEDLRSSLINHRFRES